MRVARLEIVRFRGFDHLQLIPRASVCVIGEPGAGRSDIIAALRCVLDPRTPRQRPSEWDVFRRIRTADPDVEEGSEPQPGLEPRAEAYPSSSISVSLVDLSPEIEQELDAHLELLDPATGAVVGEENQDAVLGLRLTYRLELDQDERDYQHRVEFSSSAVRVSRAHRELLRAYVIDNTSPLQLRAEGLLRRLASEPDPEALATTLEAFADEIAEATQSLAHSDEVQAALELVSRHGAGRLLGFDQRNPTESIGFAAEDGSLAALLRAIQPTLDLDDAGSLPLRAHGSTATAVLAAAEAAAAARSEGAIVLADDFGDQLDSGSAEYLAARLRRRAGQLWLTTRQPQVQRAFDPEDLVRLTRRTGRRLAFQLSPDPTRKERVRRRHLATLLAPAISAAAVVLVEGPHDFEAYSALMSRQMVEGKPPLAALRMRLVPASFSGGEGGKQQLPALARLAGELGMAVRIVLDNDRPGGNDALIEELLPLVEVLIHLPERVAVERALVLGVETPTLRNRLKSLNDQFELGIDVSELEADQIPDKCVWALKQKGGLHRVFIDGLPKGAYPPVAVEVLRRLRSRPPSSPLIELSSP